METNGIEFLMIVQREAQLVEMNSSTTNKSSQEAQSENNEGINSLRASNVQGSYLGLLRA